MKRLTSVIFTVIFGTFLVGWLAFNLGTSFYKTNLIEKTYELANGKGVRIEARTPMLPNELAKFKQQRNQRGMPFLVGLLIGLTAFVLLRTLRARPVRKIPALELNFRDEFFEEFTSHIESLAQKSPLKI